MNGPKSLLYKHQRLTWSRADCSSAPRTYRQRISRTLSTSFFIVLVHCMQVSPLLYYFLFNKPKYVLPVYINSKLLKSTRQLIRIRSSAGMLPRCRDHLHHYSESEVWVLVWSLQSHYFSCKCYELEDALLATDSYILIIIYELSDIHELLVIHQQPQGVDYLLSPLLKPEFSNCLGIPLTKTIQIVSQQVQRIDRR